MAELLQATTETTDPRILRSRRMLMESLAKLLIKKDFEDISVQEIADEATLNRGTFYLHYQDKNALLQAMTDARFRDLIARRGITFTDCHGALRAIALGVCDYLAENTSCPAQLARIPLEGSIIPVVEGMFQEGISRHGLAPGVDADLLAATAARAVFGAARRWFQTPDRISAEEMAARIETMVGPGDSQRLPVAGRSLPGSTGAGQLNPQTPTDSGLVRPNDHVLEPGRRAVDAVSRARCLQQIRTRSIAIHLHPGLQPRICREPLRQHKRRVLEPGQIGAELCIPLRPRGAGKLNAFR